MQPQGRIGIIEDDALFFHFLQHVVVDDFRFILRGNAGQELLFGFRYLQLLEGVLDGLRNFFPVLGYLVAWLYVVRKILEIDIAQVRSEIRQRHLHELVIGLQSVFQHPVRFALGLRDGFYDVFIKSFFRPENRDVFVLEVISVFFL